MILPNPHVAAMAPYALADLTAPPGKRLVSLCQNESLRAPSPLAIRAAAKAAQNAQLYPDPDWTDLRAALGQTHGLDPAQILCGNGSLDLIGAIARAYLGPDASALAPAHAYPFFRTATQASGARFYTAPESNLTANPGAVISAARLNTRVVFVANPGNPTGTRLTRACLITLRDALPDDTLLIIDEAYGEFSDHLNEPMFDLVARGNTAVLRTFSKAYGLAVMRVGWGFFPPAIAAEVRKLLNPNNISAPSQAAATAALNDRAYMLETCRQTAQIRDSFAAQIRALGLHVPQSHTNFALIQFPSPAAALAADAHLRGQGVFLRPQSGAGLPDCLRATIGVADDMALAADLLKDWASRKAIP